MISKTKYKIENKEIEKIFRAAGIGGITGISPLGAGEYNAVFSVSTREKEYVLKIAPAQEAPVMTYEKDMMRAEVFWYRQMREHTPSLCPMFTLRILNASRSLRIILSWKSFLGNNWIK